MKYRNISLNRYEMEQSSLIKYSHEYEEKIKKLNHLDSKLLDKVISYPELYSEYSDHQAYMICSNYKTIIGIIEIITTTDEKSIEVTLQINEEIITDKDKIYEKIDEIINSLSLYFFDKENIIIKLINDINLSEYNDKYIENKDSKKVKYIFNNKYNNTLIPALINEINETEKNLINWNLFWFQTFDLYDLNNYDEELRDAYEFGKISLQELFYKAEAIYWTKINSEKNKREITFERNGQIEYSKTSNNPNGIKYKFNYNVIKDGFYLQKSNLSRNEKIKVQHNNQETKIEYNNLNIHINNEEKKIEYKSEIINNSSIAIEILTNEYDEIIRTYVYFRTHKNNDKIRNIYTLMIVPTSNTTYTLNHMNNKGIQRENFFLDMEKYNRDLFNRLSTENLTLELLSEIITTCIFMINNQIRLDINQSVLIENIPIIQEYINKEKEAINQIKEIKGEIPLPHLQENIEIFIDKYDNKKTNNKKKTLKR